MAQTQKEIEKWITVNGQHIPIYKGGDEHRQIVNYFKKQSKKEVKSLKNLNSDKRKTRDEELEELGTTRAEAINAIKDLTGSPDSVVNAQVNEMDMEDIQDAITRYRKSRAKYSGAPYKPLQTPSVRLLSALNGNHINAGVEQVPEFLKKNVGKSLVMTYGDKVKNDMFFEYNKNKGSYNLTSYMHDVAHEMSPILHISEQELLKYLKSDKYPNKTFKLK